MIVPDINLLVYAYNADAPRHLAARRWWEEVMSSGLSIGIPWAVSLGFLRLMTHPAVLVEPMRPRAAITVLESWYARDAVEVLSPGPRHLRLLDELLDAAGVAGNLTTDAHLAAIAIEHHAELCSTDRDFSRFPGLLWRNPLD
jgi:hypothetical protein